MTFCHKSASYTSDSIGSLQSKFYPAISHNEFFISFIPTHKRNYCCLKLYVLVLCTYICSWAQSAQSMAKSRLLLLVTAPSRGGILCILQPKVCCAVCLAMPHISVVYLFTLFLIVVSVTRGQLQWHKEQLRPVARE